MESRVNPFACALLRVLPATRIISNKRMSFSDEVTADAAVVMYLARVFSSATDSANCFRTSRASMRDARRGTVPNASTYLSATESLSFSGNAATFSNSSFCPWSASREQGDAAQTAAAAKC